jgi:hypothetical protein
MTEHVGAPDPEKPPYEPTPIEAEAIAAYRAAKGARGPRIKVSIEGDVAKINHDHPDAHTGTGRLRRSSEQPTSGGAPRGLSRAPSQ